ncbi:uncharacterized protein [Coffea arabica]|uniref:Aspartic peptidase DDI1-type domain-containing protein n=1 Tax=Coffea arabica TaxID=13443 RepID=A0A6P6X3Q3_COFAR|nr:uncharacterized protein LOC113739202 [Coffea arabica]
MIENKGNEESVSGEDEQLEKEIPSYAKFLKEIMTRKRKLEDREIIALTEEYSAIIQNKLPPKLKDPRRFSLPCTIGNIEFSKALCDFGASVSLIPLTVARQLALHELKRTNITLQLADRSIRYSLGVLENVLLKIQKCIIPVNFVALDMEEDISIPIILGRPFLATAGTIIDVKNGKLKFQIGEEEGCKRRMMKKENYRPNIWMHNLFIGRGMFENLGQEKRLPPPSEIETPKLELKPLPNHLKYEFLGENETLPMIVSAYLEEEQLNKLL